MSVLVERQGAVVVVTLNRPEQRNALDGATMSGVGRALADAERDDSVAVVVLTGAGEVFCAGMDLKAFASSGTQFAQDGPGLEVFTQRLYPKPIIGAANGSAVAGGFELLLACDLVVAAEGARFGLPEVKRGLVAAGGGILNLPRRLPLALALELGLTGDPVDAARAHALGLVNRVVPASEVRAEALRLAERIAANAPLAVRFTKEQMRAVAGGTDADELGRFNKSIGPIFQSADAREGAIAFAERRPPVWTGR
ncbi:crotonase/enoyl-CoA hydratase family protein [Frankia sp. CNm7]|uniref:Crotonase/enoyl-CoA hydratase family protein n=1 Tax=Frankia nepalensis TaxID=1836974 RepID=A0A937UTM1_9ACTN|nr:crotonase/enoyl-CoA hydratase family protein [Frankia nepalensis]MBL7498677.1 crotonase/enoyl-CoA hydratase family protein [Frankia nepalensis]MBL7509157.1 crotonase/enoyl-CoA hydratase family protein [Frankia nepalensis]MBL7523066.1 crotonase/enoyl-CoA hydratase family protein [Frankia nepalensis]MBL7633238.1 crotonase/enoyl-CoA hydratase family protein [Frankia nepalensis]